MKWIWLVFISLMTVSVCARSPSNLSPSSCILINLEQDELLVPDIKNLPYLFTSLHHAVNKCPFDPVQIFVIGIIDVSTQVVYTQPKDLTIMGIDPKYDILVNPSNFTVTPANITITFANITLYGNEQNASLFTTCLDTQNLGLFNVHMIDWYAKRVVCQNATQEGVKLVVKNSYFDNVPCTALWANNITDFKIVNNTFQRGNADLCNEPGVYLNTGATLPKFSTLIHNVLIGYE